MRPTRLLLLSLVLFAPGCSWLKTGTGEQDRVPRFTGPIPKKEPVEFINYLNQQAESLRSVSYTDVRATAAENGKDVGSLNDSSLFAAQPRYFRLLGSHTLAGKMLDAGSNDREFWMYLKPIDGDNFFYCRHEDFARGTAKFPVPFDPDWVLMALGMTGADPDAVTRVDAREKEGVYVLYQKATTRQGQPVTKATVFNVDTDGGRRPAVKGHIIYDDKQAPVARAEVRATKTLRTTDPTGKPISVQVPTHVFLEWPQQKFTMDLRLAGEKVNEAIDDARAKELYDRPTIRGTNPIDLATYTFPTSRTRGQMPDDRRGRGAYNRR
jgi:hypothetical protein